MPDTPHSPAPSLGEIAAWHQEEAEIYATGTAVLEEDDRPEEAARERAEAKMHADFASALRSLAEVLEEDRLPMQPVVIAKDGLIRFRPNRIVRTLLDAGPLNLNDLARMDFTNEEWEQFAQLIGYSIGGYSELSYVSDESYAEAERRAEPLRARLRSLSEPRTRENAADE